jgi:hypothetical protein
MLRMQKPGERLMTMVVVNSGACGFTVKVTAAKGKERTIAVTLDTACEMVQKMLEDIAIWTMSEKKR